MSTYGVKSISMGGSTCVVNVSDAQTQTHFKFPVTINRMSADKDVQMEEANVRVNVKGRSCRLTFELGTNAILPLLHASRESRLNSIPCRRESVVRVKVSE